MCYEYELDWHGEMFGYRFHERENTKLVTIYIEDDGAWYEKMTFSEYWLDDFFNMMQNLKEI